MQVKPIVDGRGVVSTQTYICNFTYFSYVRSTIAAYETQEGELSQLDFHALRLAYVNLVLESGVSPKEAQALARYSTPI